MRRLLRGASLLIASLALCVGFWPDSGAAQGQGRGYELALYGNTQVDLGGQLRVTGTAYAVLGLAELRPLSGGSVVARITKVDSRGEQRADVAAVTVQADREGHFSLSMEVPEEPLPQARLEITLRDGDDEGRNFEWGLSTRSPLRLDLLTDRNLYEPGEHVRVWTRLVRNDGDRPVGGRRVRLRVLDPRSRPVAERIVQASPAGVATLDVELPQSATDGHYPVTADLVGAVATATASKAIRVGRRTVERLLVETTIDQAVVPPAGTLTGAVTVRTPSGAPVVGARVEIRTGEDDEPTVLRTDGQGEARFRVQAPAFLSGDVAAQTLAVRVIHPAHGALHSGASYLLSRVEWKVAATAGSGGLVPEVESVVYVSVTDPRGEPAPVGTTVVVEGPAVRGRTARVTTDRHGLVEVPMRVPFGAAAPISGGGAGCNGSIATIIDVTVETDHPAVARACVRVAPEAQVLLRTLVPVVAPGGEVAFEVQRRPGARGRAVLVEALLRGRAVAWTWLGPSATRDALVLPRDIGGVVELRARAVHPTAGRTPLDQDGAAAVGTGSIDAVLVRPADAFALEVDAGSDVYRVRQRARIGLRTAPAPQQGYVALVARDLAAHGGEQPWSLDWMGGAIERSAADPSTDDAALLLRAALAASLSPDSEAVRPPPLDPAPWERRQGPYGPASSQHRGQLRDPLALRDEMLRRGVGRLMAQLEGIVAGLGADPRTAAGVIRNRTFDPDIIANLVRTQRMNEHAAETLGGEQLTLAMLTAADPSFTFDTVARRVARQRLMRLMVALASFANPDDANAARASAGEPPSRWLSRMVQLNMLTANELVDPWGNAYQFRRASAGQPPLVISERAPDFELVSAGPDGRVGTRDDVRDPFARVVPRGTPYAVASGEDALMQRLSLIAPGSTVLATMAQAYDTLSLAAQEEQRRSVVTATASEADALGGLELDGSGRGGGGTGEGTIGLGNLGTIGHGAGGGEGQGYGRATSAARRPAPSQPSTGEAMPMEEAEMAPGDMDVPADDRRSERTRTRDAHQAQSPPPPPASGSRLAVMGELIRERFPATLFFLGEGELEASGQTVIEVPLADALTTYRLEAIAWTRTGWTTAGRTEVRVDQEAQVDAPIPPFATTGDVLRIPVRVANRTAQPISARVEVSSEGGVHVRAPAPRTIEVPPNDAVELITEVTVGAPAEGMLVVRAVRAADGSPLDAVRRPLAVLPDARLVRDSLEVLVRSGTEIEIEVPEDATERGPGELRLAVGTAIFGDPGEWGPAGDPLWAGWALGLAGQPIPETLLSAARSQITAGDPDEELRGNPLAVALAVSVGWRDRSVSDAHMVRALRLVSGVLEGASEDDAPNPQLVQRHGTALMGLALAIRTVGRRPGARRALLRLSGRLRTEVGDGAARATEAPALWTSAAAALALTRGESEDSRARELLRRIARDVIEVGDEAWLEPPGGAGEGYARVVPTALLALARIGLDERDAALPLVRNLAGLARGAERWRPTDRALASAAAGMLSGGAERGSLRVMLDGHAARVREAAGISMVVLPHVGRPGSHRLEVQMPGGDVALATLDVRYGRPWSAAPVTPAPVEIVVEGEVGARDTRAGLGLRVRNRGARVLAAPVAELDLPAGVELDEPTRELLEALARSRPTVEGRTVRIELRPIAPGGHVTLPLPVRWSVGGRLRGLGVTVYDEAWPRADAHRPTAVLASDAIEVADRGEEPTQAASDASPSPSLPPPPPPPPPVPLLERLGPVALIERALPSATEVIR